MNRNFLLGAIGVSVVILLAWWFLMWSPAGEDIAAAESRFDVAQSQVSSLTAQVARLEATQEQMPQLQSRLQTLSAAVPDSPDMYEFILAANQAGDDSALDFLTITAEEPKVGATGMTEIGIQITGAGGYFQMLDFINRLQAMQRIFVIDNMTASGAPVEGPDELLGPPDLNVTLSGKLFVVTPTASAPAEGA